MAKVRIYETPEGSWTVEFGNNTQTFTLDYYPDTEEEAEWMAHQLMSFFSGMEKSLETSKNSLHKHGVIKSVCDCENQELIEHGSYSTCPKCGKTFV